MTPPAQPNKRISRLAAEGIWLNNPVRPREACGTMEFYRAEEMIAAGRQALEEALGSS